MTMDEPRGPGGPGYETRDVDVRRVSAAGLALAIAVVVVLVAMVLVFDHLARKEAEHQPEPTTMTARPGDQTPPEPRLQQSPVSDLAQMRAEEETRLDSYGWVDRKSGTVRIPIARAMEIVVARGMR